MAAVQMWDETNWDESPWALPEPAPSLRLVSLPPTKGFIPTGAPLAQRLAARRRQRRGRRRVLVALALLGAFAVLATPGRLLGSSTASGLSTDLANSSVLAAGMDYVVQPGDTLGSIARDVNPDDPARARALLVKELGSSVVVAGEHVLIP